MSTKKYISVIKYFDNNHNKILGYSQANIVPLMGQNLKYFNSIDESISKQWQLKNVFLAVSNQVIFNEIFIQSEYKLDLPFEVLLSFEDSIGRNIDKVLSSIIKYCSYKKWMNLTRKVARFKAKNKLTKTMYERIKEWNSFRLRAEFCFEYFKHFYHAHDDSQRIPSLPVDKEIIHNLVKTKSFGIITHLMHPNAPLPRSMSVLSDTLFEYDKIVLKNKNLITFLKKFNNFRTSEAIPELYFVGGV